MAATTPSTKAKGLARPAAALALPGARVLVAAAPPEDDDPLPPADEVAVVVEAVVVVAVVDDFDDEDNVGETMVELRTMGVTVPEAEALTGKAVDVVMVEFNAADTEERMEDTFDEAEELTDAADEAMDDEAEGE